MKNTFVTNIQIKNIRHLNNLSIPLSTTERKHLILTGRNGSGKTFQKIPFKEQHKLDEKINATFVQYLVNMRYDKLDAKDLNELDTVRKIDNWFQQFTQSLKQIDFKDFFG
ncbi:MAG: hypothetical protein RIS64_159 [Bacteroidota bacterium]|jgi:excinuclease UvrABC ATPase subunit